MSLFGLFQQADLISAMKAKQTELVIVGQGHLMKFTQVIQ
jgi:hypothetical protein